MDIGTIYDGSVLVRGNLAFLGVRMVPFEEESGNVVIHGEAAGALSVIPLKVDASIQTTLPIFSDDVVFLEGIAYVVGMTFTDLFNTKVVNNEAEEDGTPFVTS